MPVQRPRLAVNVGNLLELASVVALCWAVDWLAGASWCLVAAGVAGVLLAELVYDGHVLRVPIPRRPHLLQRLRAWRTARALYRVRDAGDDGGRALRVLRAAAGRNR